MEKSVFITKSLSPCFFGPFKLYIQLQNILFQATIAKRISEYCIKEVTIHWFIIKILRSLLGNLLKSGSNSLSLFFF